MVMDSVPDVLPGNLCLVDAHGTIIEVNEAWERFVQAHGVSPAAAGPGCNYLEVCRHAAGPSSDAAAAFATNLQALLRGERANFEIKYFYHEDGEARWFLAHVWRFPGDGPVEAVIQHTEHTRRDETPWRDIAMASERIGSWDRDVTTNRTQYSSEWKHQLGYRDAEIGARYEEWESRLHPEDKARALAQLAEELSGAATSFSRELRLRHKDGSYRWFQSLGKIERDAAGKVLRVYGVHVDVTGRKRLEAALKLTRERGTAPPSQLPSVKKDEC